ncbi:MAG: response regulator [Pseudomonadota bacterium]|nr:response regulator [Pseudomonadota bacterium]
MPSPSASFLVVDDNEDDIELLRIAMRRCGSACGISVATNGADAIRRLGPGGDDRPDLVLLDWKMPGVSGAEVLRAIRENPAMRGLPVLVFSSSSAPDDIRAAHALGATGYLPKPADMSEYLRLAQALDDRWCRRGAPPG